MLIKQQALASYLAHKPLPNLYILIGQEPYFLAESADNIRQAWQRQEGETEETTININNATDWNLVAEKANSYSLFANRCLVDIRYDKKTIDATAKAFLNQYLKNINPSCLLLIRAPNLPLKQLQGLTNNNSIHVVQIFNLNALAIQSWIKEKLLAKGIAFEPEIPTLIHLYTQGNMLACAQAIEKIELINEDTLLTAAIVKEQLVDQCHYQLFELSDACLSQNANKAIHYLRHARTEDTEPTLILWLLAQDIRLLIQLIELTSQSIPLSTACSQLKIWSQRSKLYQSSLKHLHKELLLQLLQFCKKTDEYIKSNQSNRVWYALEQIALSLCLGKKVGVLA
ncbi:MULTISPECIES: DNA polymerase III subunit delta [unclassified Legionella]|uniref:DNA polymerase III subunit delta n=1 Tax=unclassified Legionella TaxID=2622702 RepID=UPI001056003D|nr:MULTISPECIES: DNA polymerase III subunit delta [unclassified Legionella]MDI9818856.1 DNA polymerase III subunit delta [Legionella sp. PL877]